MIIHDKMTDQEKEEAEKFIKMGTKYKNVFASLEGQAVLEHLAFNILGTFRADKTTEADMALSNAGAEILNYVGCSDVKLMSNTIIRAIINVSPITISKGENK